MSPLGITVLLLAAFVPFAYFSARKLAHRGGPAARGALGPALDPAAHGPANGLLQQRMIRREWKPGVMHTVIFLGFVSLLVRKVQLIVIGFDEQFALTGPLGDAFTVWKDLVEVGVLAGGGLCLLSSPAVEAGAARAQSRRTAGAGPDHDHHAHGLRVRRVPLRAVVGFGTRASPTSARTPRSAGGWRGWSRTGRRRRWRWPQRSPTGRR